MSDKQEDDPQSTVTVQQQTDDDNWRRFYARRKQPPLDKRAKISSRNLSDAAAARLLCLGYSEDLED